MKFSMYDAVELTQSISLDDEQTASIGTIGAVVEVLNQGDAYLVELFGQWVQQDQAGNLIAAHPGDVAAFVETLGVAMATPEQLRLRQPAEQTVGEHARLYTVVESMPAHLVKEVADFAEFLHQKTRQETTDAQDATKVYA